MIDLIGPAISLVDKVIARTPEYPQKKKEEWVTLKNRYNTEKSKTYPERDDDLLMNLKEQVTVFISAFSEEVE